ncbi:hypothetical protein CIK05_10790 [Bdellovibrio sp. qaytius]|nr:hypothetical protein CIK05_10790 [Bdellovibrio sp. qaytius]
MVRGGIEPLHDVFELNNSLEDGLRIQNNLDGEVNMKATCIKAVTIVFLACICSISNAGYEKTSWGMSTKQIQSLYPGGNLSKGQNSEPSYDVIRTVAGLSTAYLTFSFNTKSELSSVQILFPKQGTKVDLKTSTFTQTSNDEAEEIFKTLYSALKIKYGKEEPELQKGTKFWIKNKDLITLAFSSINKTYKTAAITYEKMPSLDGVTNGL